MEEKEYVHLPLGQEVRSISGGYVLEKEVRAEVDGREVLYVMGVGIVDSACCGVGGSRYALVPGFLLAWHAARDAEGRDMSMVSRIADQETRRRVTEEIRRRERQVDVQFL